MPKFTEGSIIRRKDTEDRYNNRIEGGITIEVQGVVDNGWKKTSFYIINEQLWPIPYVEKRYKMLLGSLLKQL